jgi:ParB family transcriptional regulator, chromosome partitioning protein
MEVQTWPIENVRVSERVRRDLGDLESLKASLTGRGLINPIGVKTDGTLVTGERRLTAAREIGWTNIDVRVYRDIDDLELLDIEVEENTCRKALTPGEAEKRYSLRKALLTPEAKEQQGTRTDLQPGGNLPRGDEKTRDKAAKPTGFSARTLDKVTKVRETAEDETVEPEVREEAQRQLDALTEGTAKPDPALKAVAAAKRRAEKEKSKLKTGLGPGQWIEPPPAPKPTRTLTQRVVDAINRGKETELEAAAEEAQGIDLDLNDETVGVLIKRLTREVKARQNLNRTLKGMLDKRKSNQP